MSSPLERRRFNRLAISLPVQYETWHPESGELHQGQGTLRDISLTGSFLHLDHEVPLQPGQPFSITIASPLRFLNIEHISHFKAHGEVVRLEPPSPTDPRLGIAVNFFQNLSFASA